jgi:hypothetical protein
MSIQLGLMRFSLMMLKRNSFSQYFREEKALDTAKNKPSVLKSSAEALPGFAQGAQKSRWGWRRGKGLYLLLLCPYLIRLVRHVQRFMHERISSTPRTSIKSFHGVKRSLNEGRLKTTDWAKK